jgi:type II secretory pathway predicted ATPase ExeA/tetratricopeptide (TPR) repeat protein
VRLARGRLALDLDRLASGEVLGGDTDKPLDIAGFLEGFDIPDSGEFALWKDRVHARLLPGIMRAFGMLLDSSRRRGDTREIEQLATRMLSLDELCEDAIRARMESLAFSGDRLAALRLYEEWRETLARELNAGPSEEIESMAISLRARGWERTPLSAIPAAPFEQRRGRHFIGRASEYRVLFEAWERVRDQHPSHILVLGDSGIGKTTLVDRLTTAASLGGAAISRVQCYDLDKDIPYAVLTGLVTGLLARPEVMGTTPEALAGLALAVPQVRQKFPSLPQARDVHGETARIELTESFQQLLEALTDEVPVVLVVDDFHLADDASLAVLHLLVRRLIGRRIMLVLIARSGEMSPGTQAARLREASSRLGIHELELIPLTEDESSQLLTCLAEAGGADLTPSVKRVLIEAAAGFPMVLELLLQDWQAHGDRAIALSLEAMTAELGPEPAHVSAYRQLLDSMLKSVDPVTKSVLQLASLLGPRLNDLTMYRLVDLSLGQTMSALAQLTDLRVLRDDARGLEFVNELIRAQVYASVPSSVKRALHGAIADRLISSDTSTPPAPGLEVAWHCVRAGRQREAVPHLMRGARQAMRQGAPHVAERALESALATLEGREWLDAALLLVESLQEQGRWRESLDHLGLIPVGNVGEACWQSLVLDVSAKMNLGAGLSAEAFERIPDLLGVIRQSSVERIRIRAARVVAYIALHDWNTAVAREVLRLVGTIDGGGLDEDAAGELALTRGLLLYLSGNTRASRSEVDSMISDYQRSGTANLVAVQLLIGLGTLRARDGSYDQAIVDYHEALRMATRLGNDTLIATIMGNLAVCLGRLGHYEEQLRISSNAPQPWGVEFGGFVELQLVYCQSLALAMRGFCDRAEIVTRKLEERLHGSPPQWVAQAWGLWKADLMLLAGNKTVAYATAEWALQAHDAKPLSPGFAGPFARWLGQLGRAGHRRKEAINCIENLLTEAEDYDVLDRSEILCASLLTTPPIDHVDPRRARLAELLLQLPLATVEQLRRLDALPPD